MSFKSTEQYNCIIYTHFLMVMLICSAGCGNNTYSITGKIIEDGQAISVSEARVLRIGLRSIAAAKNSTGRDFLNVHVGSRGEFNIQNVPPGRYALLVSDFIDYPSKDRLADFFRKNPNHFEIVVPPTSDDLIVVDLDSHWYKPKAIRQ